MVGAGPTGLACGIELQQRGVRRVLIEKGCVVNSIYHYPTNMTFFTTPELLEIGNIPMTSLNEKPNRTEALKYYRRVADHFSSTSANTSASIASRARIWHFKSSPLTAEAATQVYQARKIVLATGYYDVPNMLNVPGEDLPKVLALLQRAASLLQPRCRGHRRQEFRRHRGAWNCSGRARASL